MIRRRLVRTRCRLSTTALSCGAFLLLLAQYASPAQAYRTAADLEQIPDDAFVRWNGSIQLTLADVDAEDFDVSDAEQALESAIAAWSQPSCADVPWAPLEIATAAATPSDGTNTIQWLDSGWSDRGFDETAPATTDVYYEEQSGRWQIIEADVYLNGPLLSEASVDVTAVLTHELGHVLGLLHSCALEEASSCSSEETSAVMYPAYSANQTELSSDDERGVCSLYPVTTCGADAGTDAGDCPTESDNINDAGAPPDGCSADGGPCDAGASPSSPADFGQTCAEGTDCTSGICLDDSALSTICTRTCSDSDGCPAGWRCSSVQEESVCVPNDGGDGCSVSLAPSATASTNVLILLSLLSLYTRRRGSR